MVEGQGRFAGKVAVVTGGAGGIGSASARRLSADGARVVVVDLDEVAAKDVAAALPGEAVGVSADISTEDGVQLYTEAALDAFGRVDLHHLNAGVFGAFTELVDISGDEFDHVMNINVRGTFFGIRAAFRQFRDQGEPGSIVLTASIAGHTGSADLLPYQVSKHAVVGLVHAAAVYGGPLGVRVNGVAPGIVPTNLFAGSENNPGGGDDMVRRASTTPLRRAGRAEEIAASVAYLLSDDAGYVTGEVLVADGGASIVNTVRPSGGAGAWSTGDVDAAIYGAGWNR